MYQAHQVELTLYQTPIVVEGEVRALIPLPQTAEVDKQPQSEGYEETPNMDYVMSIEYHWKKDSYQIKRYLDF